MARPERHAGAGKRPGRAHGHNGHAAGAGQRAGSPLSEEMRVTNDWEERRGSPRDQVQPKQKIGFLIRKTSLPSRPQPALTYVRKSFATRDFSGIGASRAPAAPNSGTSVAQRGASAPAGTSAPNGHTQRPGAAETAPGPHIGAYPRAPFSVARPSRRHAALGFAHLGAQAPRLASETPDIPPYAQASKALTFWPHFMPLVNASQMFPPPL